MKCVLINDGTVADIKTLTDEEIQAIGSQYAVILDYDLIYPPPHIGDLFNGTTVVGASAARKITKLALRRRLTFPELIALTTAAMTNATIAALKDNLTVANYVDLNRPDTIAGVGILVSAGLLTSDRATAILSAPIQDDEKYKGTE